MAAGVTFVNAWSSPVCSPTRACLYTGKHSFRHGVYSPEPAGQVLGSSFRSIADMLGAKAYVNGLFGKWHLGADTTDPCTADIAQHPVSFGWDTFVGAMGGAVDSYTDYHKIEEHAPSSLTCSVVHIASPKTVTGFRDATTQAADEAYSWINEQCKASKRWMATIAFNAPHAIKGNPETWEDLGPIGYNTRTPVAGEATEDIYRMRYRTLLEHMDYTIGKLLDTLSASQLTAAALENTLIVFLGDNGESATITENYDCCSYTDADVKERAKNSVYEGGIRVPLIMSSGYRYRYPVGASGRAGTFDIGGAIGRFEPALVQTIDLWRTCASLAGSAEATEDSVSMLTYLQGAGAPQQRNYVFAEARPTDTVPGKGVSCTASGWDVAIAANIGTGGNTIKLIIKDYNRTTNDGTRELYNLSTDAWERTNLYGSATSLAMAGTYAGYMSTLRSKLETLLGVVKCT